MVRCKPLLGTYVEISVDDHGRQEVIDKAFGAIQTVDDLMSFHNPQSELNRINHQAHEGAVHIHPWTAQVLKIAKDIHRKSHGLFDCGIGHRLVAAGLLPNHIDLNYHNLGGIQDLQFLAPDLIRSLRPVCLDLGGIAKGFAVDMAVRVLISEDIPSGVVNAGGDLRVFGKTAQRILVRNPSLPNEVLEIGSLKNGAIATSGLYFARRDRALSHIINPFAQETSDIHLETKGSFSILAKECIYADALTKVLALSNNTHHSCFKYFSAKAIRITA